MEEWEFDHLTEPTSVPNDTPMLQPTSGPVANPSSDASGSREIISLERTHSVSGKTEMSSNARYEQVHILYSTIAEQDPSRSPGDMPFVKETGKAVLSKVHVEWKIHAFILLSKKVGDFYHSPVFSFFGAQWYLRLYPNSDTDESPEQMGLYLMRKDSGYLKTVYFTLGIKGLDGVIEEKEEIEHIFYEADEGFGFPNFWNRSELRNQKSYLMPNLELTITCDLRSNAHVNDVTGEKKLGNSLLSMLESGEDSDVVIKVQGKEFPAHRCILRARSPVFNSMFTHEMVEKQSGVVTIPDCDPETFHDFLVYIFSGSSESISTMNVFSLYKNAHKYDISELKEECLKFMKRNLTVAGFCDVIALAVKYDEKELIERATNFFCDNSLEIVKTAEWQTFLNENATVGNELIIKMLSK